jgi:predicted glutamine amidotransferase
VCRFYALRASAPTTVRCCLVEAPNSLLTQSRQDLHGFEHADGWGIAGHGGAGLGVPREAGWTVERHADPAHGGVRFRAAAERICATTVLAHVRRATVGKVAPENTHPFRHGRWSFLHNGTVPYFAEIRAELLAELPAAHRAAIAGSTDSEHLFHLILASHERAPERPLLATLQEALERVIRWCRTRGQEPHLGLNVLLSDGTQMVGSRWQRSLHWLERVGPAPCPVCGRSHAEEATPGYRALLIASEPITHEAWPEVPERSVYEVTPDLGLRVRPLAAD